MIWDSESTVVNMIDKGTVVGTTEEVTGSGAES